MAFPSRSRFSIEEVGVLLEILIVLFLGLLAAAHLALGLGLVACGDEGRAPAQRPAERVGFPGAEGRESRLAAPGRTTVAGEGRETIPGGPRGLGR